MMNGDRKEGICRLNVDGNGCDYLRILSDLETKLRNNTNPKEKSNWHCRVRLCSTALTERMSLKWTMSWVSESIHMSAVPLE